MDSTAQTATTQTAADRERTCAVVHRLVALYAPDPSVQVGDDDVLLGNLGYSSLRLVELAFTIEELFAMDPAVMGDAPPVGTVGDLRDFLVTKVAAGEASVPSAADVDEFVEQL